MEWNKQLTPPPLLSHNEPLASSSQAQHLVEHASSIAVGGAALLARIIVDTAPAGVRALLVPGAAAVVGSAETGALSRVDVAAFIGDVADLVAGAGLPGASATSLLVDRGLAARAASLVMCELLCSKENVVEVVLLWRYLRGTGACRSQHQRWFGLHSMRPEDR